MIMASAFALFVSIVFGSFAFGQHATVIATEGRFIAYDNGTVLDTKTGLMWAARDDGKGIDEQDAVGYFENFRGGGYADWRMPTVDELETIYDPDLQNRQGFHVTRLIDITGEWVWCSEGPEFITTFNFKDGSRPLAFFEGPGSGTWYSTAEPLPTANRALPVRYAGNIEKMKAASPLPQKRKIEIAVFPWRFKLPQWYADPSPTIDACLNGVFEIIQKFDEIELKYSYYEYKNFRPAKVEPIKSLIENNEKVFWLKQSSSFDFQPNYDVIYAYGEQINADLVFLTSIESSGILESIKVYLIDINNRKNYAAIDRRPYSPTDAFLALSQRTIENFLRETKKASQN
jgi:hypothetical protein